ncbi:hypothetical protein A4X09_0g3496 [Tilletia walkeri]|uniref:Major facilitator superfamily (MFS) profile domain-containing protein n=1 Tax=Tilletia walkeri TaxID=117179 RepID=A0A8X7N990_9BASI|nr:hypothetical protein A4X09_0g3496 [Tilletia walkeri]
MSDPSPARHKMPNFIQRLITIPTKEERIRARAGAPLNPFKLAAMLTPLQAAWWLSGFSAWSVDAADFFAVSLNVARLATYFGFGKNNHKVTTAITLTVLLRPVGGIIFGLLSDRYGRKWPLIFNLVLIAAFSVATARVQTFHQFLAVRALFGIGMGGIWGMATATAIENMPRAPRGLFSGMLQQGYPVGYIISAVINIAWVNHSGDWRILFYVGAGLSLLAALFRLVLPESALFLRIKAERKAYPSTATWVKTFTSEVKWLARNCTVRVIYGILIVTGLSFMAHASQDAYPLILQKAKGLSPYQASVATIIGSCGAVVGGLAAGYISQYIGRRLTVVIYSAAAGLLIPAWMLPNSFSRLAAGVFFLQFMVQGVGGILPALLQDMAPTRYRATFPGVVHQTGVMLTAYSAQIITTIGDHNPIRNPKYVPGGQQPETIPNYANVSAIFLAIVVVFLLLVVIFGPEYDGAPALENTEAVSLASSSSGTDKTSPTEKAASELDSGSRASDIEQQQLAKPSH